MSKYKGKRVLVVGLGKSGVSVAKYMVKQGAKVMVTDSKQRTELAEYVNQLEHLKVEFELGKHNEASFRTAELIVVSPGVPLNIKPLDFARESQVPITSEIELAVSQIKEPIIAVTGTNGKTTTTTMIGEILKADGRKAFVGGNIGKPLLDYVLEEERADYVVAEVSSFQLEQAKNLIPAVAVFTNLEPDHMDRYSSFSGYGDAKKNLLRNCDKNSYVVINYDCPNISQFINENPGKLFIFTKQDPISIGGSFAENFRGCYWSMANRQIVAKINGKDEIYDLSKFKLFGEHNRENLMAAISATRALGISPTAIQRFIDEFKGIAHRLEFVRKKDGVWFFNDSKATNVASVAKSLTAFAPQNPIILIAGGRDKNQEFGPLAELVRSRCKILILVGEAKEKLNRALGDFAETFLVGTFEEAVLIAFQKSRTGDIILLSPACASFDMFRNYEERGDYFKKLVQQL